MTRKIVYRTSDHAFFDVTIISPSRTEDQELARRQRFIGVCFCGRSTLSNCPRCGWHTPVDRARLRRDAFEHAISEDGRIAAMLAASLAAQS